LINHILFENSIYLKTTKEGIQKIFYYYPVNNDNLVNYSKSSDQNNILLSEGDLKEYQIHVIGGQNYYPLIIGYEEAKIMRKEGLFSNIGDPIKGFFGKNVVLIGVISKTNTILDISYMIPLSAGELD
jgi:hypothetical protein